MPAKPAKAAKKAAPAKKMAGRPTFDQIGANRAISALVEKITATDVEEAAAALTPAQVSRLRRWAATTDRLQVATGRRPVRIDPLCDGVHHPPGRILGGICVGCGQTISKK